LPICDSKDLFSCGEGEGEGIGRGGNALDGLRGRSVDSSSRGVPARGFVGYIVLSAENDPLPVVVEAVESVDVGNGTVSRPLPFKLPSLGTLSRSVTVEGTGDGVGPLDLKLGRALSSKDGLASSFLISVAVDIGVVVVLDLTLKPSGIGGGLGVDSFSFPLPVLNSAFKAPDDFLSDSPDVLRVSSFSTIAGGGVATPRFLCASFCIAFNSFFENISPAAGRSISSDFRNISSDFLRPSSDFLDRSDGVDILLPVLKIFNRLGFSIGEDTLSRIA
jgi:hypothetical protein